MFAEGVSVAASHELCDRYRSRLIELVPAQEDLVRATVEVLVSPWTSA